MSSNCIAVLMYPTETSPSKTFAPVRGFTITTTGIKFRSNAVVHEMVDPRIQYTYAKGGTFRERTYEFVMDSDEVEDLYEFWSASLGHSFKLLDPFTAGGYVLQRFPKEASEPVVTLANGDPVPIWKCTLTMRDAVT